MGDRGIALGLVRLRVGCEMRSQNKYTGWRLVLVWSVLFVVAWTLVAGISCLLYRMMSHHG